MASQEGAGIGKRAPFVDLIFGPQTLHRLPAMLEDTKKKNKPIIMIGGLNGAGKTSILTAIKLGQFGKASLKGSITTKSYSSYMKEQINKDSRNVNFASVAIDFDFVKQGKNYHYLIDRSWKVNQNKLTESLSVSLAGYSVPSIMLT